MNTTPILGFKKPPFQYLSNMHRQQGVWVDYDEWSYPTVEHAYQASKTLDKKLRKLIYLQPSPFIAKNIAKGFIVRQDFHQIKLGIMEDLLRQKFNTPPLNMMLKATGTCHIEEVNWWNDTYWGTCKGVGENHLGKLIMKIREELQ